MSKCKNGCQMKAGGKTCAKCGCDMSPKKMAYGGEAYKSGGIACMKCGGKMHKSGGKISSCMKCGGGKYTFGGKTGWMSKKKVTNKYAFGGAVKQYQNGGPVDPRKKMQENYLAKKGWPIPTKQDSIDVMNKSIELQNYYKNKNYDIKKPSYGDYGQDYINEMLDNNYKDFYKKPNKVTVPGTFGSRKVPPSSVTYRKPQTKPWIVEQRESANAKLDTRAPFPYYDLRISPTKSLQAFNANESDQLYNDRVYIYSYDPIYVKPYSMRTPEEHKLYQQRYGNYSSTSPTTQPVSQMGMLPQPVLQMEYKDTVAGQLEAMGIKPTFENRQKIAKDLGYENYSGTMDQNIQLLKDIQSGMLNKTNNQNQEVAIVESEDEAAGPTENVMLQPSLKPENINPSPNNAMPVKKTPIYFDPTKSRYDSKYLEEMRKRGAIWPEMSFGGAVKKYRDGGMPDPDGDPEKPKKKKTPVIEEPILNVNKDNPRYGTMYKGGGYEYYIDEQGYPVITLSDEDIERERGNYDYDNVIKKSNITESQIKLPEIKPIEKLVDETSKTKSKSAPLIEKITVDVPDNESKKLVSNKKKTTNSINMDLPNWGRAKKEQEFLNNLIRKDIASGNNSLALLLEDDIIGPKTLEAMNYYQKQNMYERPELFKDKWLKKYKEDILAGKKLQVPGVTKPIEPKVPKVGIKNTEEVTPQANDVPIDNNNEKNTIEKIYDYFNNFGSLEDALKGVRNISKQYEKNQPKKEKENLVKVPEIKETILKVPELKSTFPDLKGAYESVKDNVKYITGEASKYGKGLYDKMKDFKENAEREIYNKAEREYDMMKSKTINIDNIKKGLMDYGKKAYDESKIVYDALEESIKKYQSKKDKEYSDMIDKEYPKISKKAKLKQDYRNIKEKYDFIDKAQSLFISNTTPAFKQGYIRNDYNDLALYNFMENLENKVWEKYKNENEFTKGNIVRRLIDKEKKKLGNELDTIKKQIDSPLLKT